MGLRLRSSCALWLMACLAMRTVNGDIYMHNFRGSNNRLDENGRNRANGNRLFDSQNNQRGGYNVGSLYHYVGSVVQLEWTNQHGCGKNPNLKCELVLQYMCDDDGPLRDGTSTNTIPEQGSDDDMEYGRHESSEYYQWCKTRERNQGLFIASQDLKGDTAKYTRQNPQGTRRGLECPEERDYYPYWHPSPWRDIAVLTDDTSRCSYYQTESQNVKGKGVCQGNQDHQIIYEPNNPADCQAAGGQWNATYGAWNTAAPECHVAPWTRDNHLGNTLGGQPPSFNWTIPGDVISENCALRLRYNISTGEYDGWDGGIDASKNDEDGLALDLTSKYGYEAPFKNNPQVDFLGTGVTFQLAVNTAQFGRTFQDRSHRFAIRPRPPHLVNATTKIHNLNVRGKRGNIVQVYPAVEYDFVPNTVRSDTGDLVHVQWTGSNTNPANNDGQGRQQTDRSNIVPLALLTNNLPELFPNASHWGQHVCSDYTQQGEVHPAGDHCAAGEAMYASLATGAPGHMGGELSELDDAGTYFDGGLVRFSKPGEYRYMCSRNNNFSNRSQKGKVVVGAFESAQSVVAGAEGGDIWTSSGTGLVVLPGTEFWPTPQEMQPSLRIAVTEVSEEAGQQVPPAVAPAAVQNPEAVVGSVAAVSAMSSIYAFEPHGLAFNRSVEVVMKYNASALEGLQNGGGGREYLLAFARTDGPDDQTWEVVPGGTFADGEARVWVEHFSLYVVTLVEYTPAAEAVSVYIWAIGGTAAGLAVVGAVFVFLVYRGKRTQHRWGDLELREEAAAPPAHAARSASLAIPSLLMSSPKHTGGASTSAPNMNPLVMQPPDRDPPNRDVRATSVNMNDLPFAQGPAEAPPPVPTHVPAARDRGMSSEERLQSIVFSATSSDGQRVNTRPNPLFNK